MKSHVSMVVVAFFTGYFAVLYCTHYSLIVLDMQLFINPWAVLVAGIISMGIGMFWYSPLAFGKSWMTILGITPEQMAEAKKKGCKGMAKSMIIGFVSALITSTGIAVLISITGPFTLGQASLIALFVWFSFMAVLHVDTVIWEGRPWKFFLINAGYRLVNTLVITAMLYFWR